MITDSTWHKVKLDKIDDIFKVVNNFSKQYWEGELTAGHSFSLLERYWIKSREIMVDGYIYKLGLILDMATRSNHAMVRLSVTVQDINYCSCSVVIDLSNKNWPEFALSARDGFHYLCRSQVAWAKNNNKIQAV